MIKLKIFKKKELTEQQKYERDLKKFLKKYPRRDRKRLAFLWSEYQKGNILKIEGLHGEVSKEV